MSLWKIITRAAVLVLGITSVLEAQEPGAGNGPVICPPITCPDCFLTPTLLDALIYPGFTFWS